MKLLQNKAVVIGLALAGFGVMAFNIGAPIYRRAHPRRPAPASAPAASQGATSPVPASPVSPGTAIPDAKATGGGEVKPPTPQSPAGGSIDRTFYVTRFPEWVESPPLDPFTPPPTPPPEAPKGPSAVDALKLQGTWRQTGGMVAVINRLAVMEGETVNGFTVNRIEADRVLVVGPRGVEEIRFPGDPGASAPSRAPKSQQQASLNQP